jgi:SNF2 family DNA or RNA helicase
VSVRYPDISDQFADVRIRVRVQRAKGATNRRSGGTAGHLLSAEQLLDFDWTLVLGDQELTPEEFERMVQERAPYVQVDGSWRLVPIQQILEQVDHLRAVAKGKSSVPSLDLVRTVLMNQGEDRGSVAWDVSFAEGASRAREVLAGFLAADRPTLLSEPVGFRGTLRGYQRFGYSWLYHLRSVGCGGVLADDMGLGKTVQVLAYLLYLKESGQADGVHLLVCPTSLLQNWRAEISRFTPGLRAHVHHGAERSAVREDGRTVLEQALAESDLVLTTYATLVRDLDVFERLSWDVVVADEAQNIKNPETQQAQAVCALQANQRVALTGTPIENRLEELWSILHFTNPGYLGGAKWFRKTFVQPLAAGQDRRAAERLQHLLKPVLLRRSKTNPLIQLELPEKWEYVEYAALTAEQAALYQSIVNQLFATLPESEGIRRRGHILTALVRLKQVCDHPCLAMGGSSSVERSGKLKLLLDLLETVVSDGESALVFTQFRDMGALLCDALAERFGWKPRFLHGGLSAGERGRIVEDFQAGRDPAQVLVLSLKAGGVGLNLTRANHVFHFDRWWNPAVEDQATDRVFRIGQVKDVQVHKLVCPGTLEERIDDLIQSKRRLSSMVVGNSEAWITELGNDALQELLALDVRAALEVEEWRSGV